MTHVVNVLGQYQGKGIIDRHWEVARSKRWSHIRYIDWPVRSESHRRSWREVFALIVDALETSSNVVLIHCKNGRDRSAFTVYAFLRLEKKISHIDAMEIVERRLGFNGRPLFRYDKQDPELTQWLDFVAGSNTSAKSGMLHWHFGTLQR